MSDEHVIDSPEGLAALYREPTAVVLDKALDHLNPAMRAFAEQSSFLVLSTTDGAGSVDASPRGGPAGFVQVLDDRHVAIPDLNGNNRLDSLRNIVAHPHVGLLLVVPGHDETLRLNGPATLTTDPEVLAGFTVELRTPKLAIVVEIAEVYGHCAKAFRRGGVWAPDTWPTAAPDLAAMYACHWDVEEDVIRAGLAESYADGLAADRA